MNQQRYPGLKKIVVCILISFGCREPADPTSLFRDALQSFRDGKSTEALVLARESAKHCAPDTACSWSARLFEARVLLTDNQLNEAAPLLSQELPQASQFSALAAKRTWLLANLQFSRGHPEAADVLYRKARRMASAAGAWDTVLEVDLSRARLLTVVDHDLEGAEALFHEVAEEAARRQNAYYEAAAFDSLGMVRLRAWRFDEAIPWFQRTLVAARKGGGQRLFVAASDNLGICYLQLGSFEEALKSLQRGLDLLGPGGLATYRMDLLRQMGNALFLLGEAPKAIGYFRQAAALARTNADAAKCYRYLSVAYISIHDWDAAEQANNKAASYVHDDDSRPWAEKNQAAIAEGRGQHEEASTLYRKAIADGKNIPVVLWESHAELADIYSKTGDDLRADDEYEQAINIVGNDAGKISTQDYNLTFFSTQVHLYQDYVRTLISQHDFRRALDIADSSRARLLLQRLTVSETKQPAAVHNYQGIARRLNAVLLFYFLAPGQSYLWVVTPNGIRPPISLPSAEQLRRWVNQYTAFVEDRVGDPMTTPNEAGRKLYDALLAPAKSLIPPNSRVILIPDDALNWLNFETLPVYDVPAGGQSHYWIEDVRLEIAPSLTALGTNKPVRSHRAKSLLIIGDPVSPSPEFPALEYAAQEIKTIEANFPSTDNKKFTGSLAGPGVYRTASPDRFSILHFSAHAVANKESPLDSAIILSAEGDNFKLYARDVIGIPLQADLVTVSACRSAGARSYSGEGLVGFVWAFLQAGARNVIAGLWDVTDRSTPEIMGVLYAQIAAGAEPADALRAAKLKLIHADQGYRRPYYWGPFQIYTR